MICCSMNKLNYCMFKLISSLHLYDINYLPFMVIFMSLALIKLSKNHKEEFREADRSSLCATKYTHVSTATQGSRVSRALTKQNKKQIDFSLKAAQEINLLNLISLLKLFVL